RTQIKHVSDLPVAHSNKLPYRKISPSTLVIRSCFAMKARLAGFMPLECWRADEISIILIVALDQRPENPREVLTAPQIHKMDIPAQIPRVKIQHPTLAHSNKPG